MAHVLDLTSLAPDVTPDTPSHRRVRRASKLLSVVFGAIFAAYCLFVAAGVLAFVIPYAGHHLLIGPKGMLLYIGPPSAHALAAPPAGYVAVADLSLPQRLAHLLVSPLVILPGLMIFWNLNRLFRLYGQGVVFSEANARLIKHIGLWLAANALQPLATTSILAAVHMRIDQKWFHGDTIPKIVLGAVVYVLGIVMGVGHEIEEERGQFV